jgi:hypothetical protein
MMRTELLRIGKMVDKGQSYAPWPDDGMYRGIKIPGRVKATWNNVSGRWWRQGVDDALDSLEEIQESDVPQFGRFFR